MKIALIADDAKKELMVQFCIAYCGILSRYRLYATATTGKLVTEATGLEINRLLSGEHGGAQQIASAVSCGEIDVVFFYRDPIRDPNGNVFMADDANVLRICDVHNVPYATNIATGEAMIHALERGDLDWRELV